MKISRVQNICIKTEPYANGYATEELREKPTKCGVQMCGIGCYYDSTWEAAEERHRQLVEHWHKLYAYGGAEAYNGSEA